MDLCGAGSAAKAEAGTLPELDHDAFVEGSLALQPRDEALSLSHEACFKNAGYEALPLV